MSQIGKLIPATRGDLSYLTGEVRTLDMQLSISLSGDPAKCDTREPSHRIMARTPQGMAEIGRAWLKTARHGPRPGAHFFSITIDDPSLAHPLNVAAFEDPETGEWAIVWRRRSNQPTTQAAA